MIDPLEILQQGIEILNPILLRNGFTYVPGKSGPSSGGSYAYGAYSRGERRLELLFRHILGLVTYHIGPDSLRHEVFMRSLLGRDGGNRYPGFSDDPLDGFRDLRHDLEIYGKDFLSGNGNIFRNCALEARAAKRLRPIERIEQGWPDSIEET